MRVAIIGGTGFVGAHVGRRLVDEGHRVTLISRTPEGPGADLFDRDGVEFASASVTNADAVAEAVDGTDSVVHLAGINRERGDQTFERVHVTGTQHVVAAASAAGVDSIVLSSFLRARPDCGSGYHESKWRAEEIVRDADVTHTVCKPGIVYGQGDQFVTNVARTIARIPVFGSVGLRPRRVAPLAVGDFVDVLSAAATTDQLADATVPVVGPETLTFADCVRRIAGAMGRRVLVVPLPVAANAAFARLQEAILVDPIVSRAQVRMLAEGVIDPAPAEVCTALPPDLAPDRTFTTDAIEAALPIERP